MLYVTSIYCVEFLVNHENHFTYWINTWRHIHWFNTLYKQMLNKNKNNNVERIFYTQTQSKVFFFLFDHLRYVNSKYGSQCVIKSLYTFLAIDYYTIWSAFGLMTLMKKMVECANEQPNLVQQQYGCMSMKTVHFVS